jgi:hypothetical protein
MMRAFSKAILARVYFWAFFAVATSAGAIGPVVYVTYGGTTYEETISGNVTYGNELTLMSQVWYGNTAVADIFAQAWLEQDDGEDFSKVAGWPAWITSLTGIPIPGDPLSGPEYWQGVTFFGNGRGPEDEYVPPTGVYDDGDGGYLADFITAEPVPEPSVFGIGAGVLVLFSVALQYFPSCFSLARRFAGFRASG